MRAVLFVILSCILVNSMTMEPESGHHFFVFLTWWGVFGGWLYFAVVLIETTYFKNDSPKFSHFVNLWKVIITTTEGLIVPFFWIVLFPIMKNPKIFLNLQLHLAIYVALLIDNWFNLVYYRMKDIFLISGFGVIYIIVNGSVTAYTGIPVYPVLTFTDWMTLGYICVCIVIMVLHHSLMVCLYRKFKEPHIELQAISKE